MIKMSLVTALLIGSSAMALENTKVTGDANLYYQTSDGGNKNFFEPGSSTRDMSVNLNLTTDLLKTDPVTISTGLGYTILTALGLESQLVGSVWGGAHDISNTGKVEDALWVNTAWFATIAGATIFKVGRLELDTPLAFTERWSIEKNTFESVVLMNQDIPDTILGAVYIGRGNGVVNYVNTAAVVDINGKFSNYGVKGAYTVGVINNSWEPLTVQAWYYDVVAEAQATWIQADLNIDGFIAGGQVSTINEKVSSVAAAGVLGYEVKDTVVGKLSYSKVSSKGDAGYNTATYAGGGSQSKLYTEAWWNYGQNTQAGAQTINITVEAPLAGIDFGGYVTIVDHLDTRNSNDLIEYTVSASKSIGFFDASLVYIHTDKQSREVSGTVTALTGSLDNMLQLYLTANFQY